MKFYMTDTREKKEILVRPWTGSGYGPDCFDDLEPNFPQEHKMLPGDIAYVCTSEEYAELLEWWIEEIRCINNQEIGQNGDDYTETTGDELVIIEN